MAGLECPIDVFRSACDIALAVGRGDVSAEAVVDATLERIATIDGALNAFTVVMVERAREAARTVGRRVSRGDELPLAGVPIAVKDHVWVADVGATNGSRALATFVPATTCASVERLIDAGGVIIGKTNNPEFCYRADTDSPLWGATRNPFDLSRTSGGSSGGSAVAVATGMAALAVGTDGGGSIRAPAAFCGVVGHKPTFGLVPRKPGFRGWPSLSVHGQLGRTVADVATMLSIMAGPHPADPTIVPTDNVALAEIGRVPTDLKGLRVAVSEDFGIASPQAEVLVPLEHAASLLADLGCTVTRTHPKIANPAAIWWTIAACESYAAEGCFLDRSWEVTPYSLDVIRRGQGISAAEYLEAQQEREALSQTWSEFFLDFDLMVSPGQSVLPFPIGVLGPQHQFDDSWWAMDTVANLTGQPVTSIPCGVTAEGLPVGIQLMGPRFHDALVLSAAASVEEALPGVLLPNPVRIGNADEMNRSTARSGGDVAMT